MEDKKNIKNCLALDLGTTTGWCLLEGEKILTSGTLNFSNSRFEGGGMRYLRFKRWLQEIVKINEVSEIYMEEVKAHKGTDAAQVYGGFLAVLTSFCEELKIPFLGVPVGTIKKTLCGGRADKKAIIAAVKARGHQPQDDNEADAIAIAYTVMANLK